MFRKTALLAILVAGLLMGCARTVTNRPQPASEPLADVIARAREEMTQTRQLQQELQEQAANAQQGQQAVEEQLETARKRRQEAQERLEAARQRQQAVLEQLEALRQRQKAAEGSVDQALKRQEALQKELDKIGKELEDARQKDAQLRESLKKLDHGIDLLKNEEKKLTTKPEPPKGDPEPIAEPIAPPKPALPQGKDKRPTIRGTIKEVQESSKIVLSLGSDAGLQKGDILEVFRLKPKPLYLGQITVAELKGTEAIARKRGTLKDTIRAGDEFSTNILGE